MNHIKTVGIVLSRTEYGEADRILTFLTPDNGKLRAIAKGVRKPKSKLAGGIELFGINELSFIRGKSELYTLTSSRLIKHYGNIVSDINRTMLGYDMLKILNRALEDVGGREYYDLLASSLEILNEGKADIHLAEESFLMRLMRLLGHTPNLAADVKGNDLSTHESFQFSLEDMSFVPSDNGVYTKNHIKILRLLTYNEPSALLKVGGLGDYLKDLSQLVKNMSQQYAVNN